MRFTACLAMIVAPEGAVGIGWFGGNKKKEPIIVPAPPVKLWECLKSKNSDAIRFAKYTEIKKIRNKQRTVTFNGHFDCDVTDAELESLFDAGEEPQTAEIGCHADRENAEPIVKIASGKPSALRSKKVADLDGSNLSSKEQSLSIRKKVSSKEKMKAPHEVTGEAAAIVTIFSPEGWSSAKRDKVCEEAKKIHMTKNFWSCKSTVNEKGAKVTYSNKGLGDVIFFRMGECVNLPNDVKLDVFFSSDNPAHPESSAKSAPGIGHSESSSKFSKPHDPCDQDKDNSSDAAVRCDSDKDGESYTAEIRPAKGEHLAAESSYGETRCSSVIRIQKRLEALVKDNTENARREDMGEDEEEDDDDDEGERT